MQRHRKGGGGGFGAQARAAPGGYFEILLGRRAWPAALRAGPTATPPTTKKAHTHCLIPLHIYSLPYLS